MSNGCISPFYKILQHYPYLNSVIVKNASIVTQLECMITSVNDITKFWIHFCLTSTMLFVLNEVLGGWKS